MLDLIFLSPCALKNHRFLLFGFPTECRGVIRQLNGNEEILKINGKDIFAKWKRPRLVWKRSSSSETTGEHFRYPMATWCDCGLKVNIKRYKCSLAICPEMIRVPSFGQANMPRRQVEDRDNAIETVRLYIAMYKIALGHGIDRRQTLTAIHRFHLNNPRLELKRKGARSPHRKWRVQSADLRADKLIHTNFIREQCPTLRVGSMSTDAGTLCFQLS